MTLGELIVTLKTADPNKVCKIGLGKPHSYRGYFDQLAFEPVKDVTVAAMLKDAEESVGKTFEGYKGGDYTMSLHTDVWLAKYSECGEGIGPLLIAFMLGTEPKKPCYRCGGTGFVDVVS